MSLISQRTALFEFSPQPPFPIGIPQWLHRYNTVHRGVGECAGVWAPESRPEDESLRQCRTIALSCIISIQDDLGHETHKFQ